MADIFPQVMSFHVSGSERLFTCCSRMEVGVADVMSGAKTVCKYVRSSLIFVITLSTIRSVIVKWKWTV